MSFEVELSRLPCKFEQGGKQCGVIRLNEAASSTSDVIFIPRYM